MSAISLGAPNGGQDMTGEAGYYDSMSRTDVSVLYVLGESHLVRRNAHLAHRLAAFYPCIGVVSCTNACCADCTLCWSAVVVVWLCMNTY